MSFLAKKNNAKTTLSSSFTASETTLQVSDASKFPTSGDFLITIWDKISYPDPSDDPNMEIVKVTTVLSDTFLVTRAQEETTAVRHSSGNVVEMLITAGHFTEVEGTLQEHRTAIDLNTTHAADNFQAHSDYLVNNANDTTSGVITSAGIIIEDGILTGTYENNLNAFDFGERVLGLMTDLRFLNVMCEDPSGGAGSYIDISIKGHNGTPTGTWTSGDRLKQGRTWKLDPDGTTAYIDLGDDTDFEFVGIPFTVGALVEVDASTGIQTIIAKWDSGTTLREWKLFITALEEAQFSLYDESADTEPYVKSAVLSEGLHLIIGTYDGTSGNDADDGMNLYIDGVLDNTTKSGTVGFTDMEASATAVTVCGSLNSGAIAETLIGDIGGVFIDGVELSAMDVWRLWQLVLSFYSENGTDLS